MLLLSWLLISELEILLSCVKELTSPFTLLMIFLFEQFISTATNIITSIIVITLLFEVVALGPMQALVKAYLIIRDFIEEVEF